MLGIRVRLGGMDRVWNRTMFGNGTEVKGRQILIFKHFN